MPPEAGSVALVTGGAGFIGSHVVRAQLASGVRQVVVLDDLSGGFADPRAVRPFADLEIDRGLPPSWQVLSRRPGDR